MSIPEDLKIFSLIYECRNFVLLPLIVLWLIGGGYLLFRLKKVFFLWLLIFPLVISPLQIAFVYSGWHYRMELRDRFGTYPRGKMNGVISKSVNINLMPPEIRAEYAKHNYHPRYRDMKAITVRAIVFTSFFYVLGGLGYWAVFLFRKRNENKRSKPPAEA